MISCPNPLVPPFALRESAQCAYFIPNTFRQVFDPNCLKRELDSTLVMPSPGNWLARERRPLEKAFSPSGELVPVFREIDFASEIGGARGEASSEGCCRSSAGSRCQQEGSRHQRKATHSALTRICQAVGKLYLASGLSRSMVFASGDGAMDRTHV